MSVQGEPAGAILAGTPLRPADPSRMGPYHLVSVLGSGGMGRVYLGRSAGGRLVAVKVIRAELAENPEFRTRFRREVEAARKVNGLYTALVVDADPDDELPWLATAYVAGPSLEQVIRDRGALPLASVRSLGAGLAEGLAAIHAAGLVHRDLKPANILLADDGPRVIDFGISRALEDSSLTSTSVVIGSPTFMSPEQADGGDIGPASDVFSLGTLLCYAATGRGPFGTGRPAAIIYRVVHGSPDLDRVPGEIRPLVARCLAKDPGERPATTDILAELGGTEWDSTAWDSTGWGSPRPTVTPAVSPAVTPAAAPAVTRITAGPGLPGQKVAQRPATTPDGQKEIGQALTFAGGVIQVIGLGAFLKAIVSAGTTARNPLMPGMPGGSLFGPSLPAAIALFIVGAILLSIGRGLVRSARDRARREGGGS